MSNKFTDVTQRHAEKMTLNIKKNAKNNFRSRVFIRNKTLSDLTCTFDLEDKVLNNYDSVFCKVIVCVSTVDTGSAYFFNVDVQYVYKFWNRADLPILVSWRDLELFAQILSCQRLDLAASVRYATGQHDNSISIITFARLFVDDE